MKKIFFVLGLLALCLVSQAQSNSDQNRSAITYPIDGSVIQANSSQQAHIKIMGQLQDGWSSITKISVDKRIYSTNQTYTYSNLIDRSLAGNITWNFYGMDGFTDNIGTLGEGYYRVRIYLSFTLLGKAYKFPISTIEFGIGDVYVIAGQSNAQGPMPQSVSDNNLIPYYQPSSLTNDERTRFQPDILQEGNKPLNAFPFKSGFAPLFNSTSINVPDINNRRPIYPAGESSWNWSILGHQIAKEKGTPTLFLNTAIANSSVNFDWNQNSTNLVRLNNVLFQYGNIFGAKAVLWHQGEKDSENLIFDPNTSTYSTNYKTGLDNIISSTRSTLNSNLNWFVSKVSYTVGTPFWNSIATPTPHSKDFMNPSPNRTDITHKFRLQSLKDKQQEVINTTLRKFEGISSDDINESERGPYLRVHFNGSTLENVANLWFNKIYPGGNRIATESITPTEPVEIAVGNSGSNYYFAVPSFSGAIYQWKMGEQPFTNPITSEGNSKIVSSYTSGDRLICYIKKSDGKLYISQPFQFPSNSTSLSLGSSSVNFSNTETKTTDINTINTYAGITSAPSWINASIDEYTGKLVLTPNSPNTGSSTRSATVQLTSVENSGMTASLTVNQSVQSSTSLSSLTPTSVYQEFGSLKNNLSVDGNALIINNVTYSQGLGTHAASNIKYNLGGNYSTFTGRAGHDKETEGACGQNLIQFVIKADGQTFATSPNMHWQQDAWNFNVNVSGKNQLELIVNTVGNNWCDHADWVDVYLNGSGGGGCTTPSSPTSATASPSTINSGQSSTLTASCGSGATLTWQNLSGTSPTVSPTSTSTYYAFCNAGSCQSSATPVTVSVNGGSGPCSAISNDLFMGTWNVESGYQLRARSFYGSYWITQKINVNGSQYDEFVVRASEMLTRGDVTLANSSYSGLVNCFAWQYSGYGGLVPPNASSSPPFPTPSGYCLLSNNGTSYYTNNTSLCGGGGSSGLSNNSCYKIQSLANNYYATDLGNNEIHFQTNNNNNSQIWKLEGSGTQFKVKRATQNNRMNNSGSWGETMSMNSTGVTWNFHSNNGSYRVSHPGGSTWDHRGAGGDTELQIWGNLGDGITNYRLFNFTSVGCPSGAREGVEQSSTLQEEEQELPFLGIAPNPAHDVVAVNIYLDEAGSIDTYLSNIKGELLKTVKKDGVKGMNSFALDLTGLTPGMYLIKASSGAKVESKKLLVE